MGKTVKRKKRFLTRTYQLPHTNLFKGCQLFGRLRIVILKNVGQSNCKQDFFRFVKPFHQPVRRFTNSLHSRINLTTFKVDDVVNDVVGHPPEWLTVQKEEDDNSAPAELHPNLFYYAASSPRHQDDDDYDGDVNIIKVSLAPNA